MTTASDDFNRANAGTLGANWADTKGFAGAPGILSNAAYDPFGDGTRIGAYYSATTFTADQFSQATVPTAVTVGNGGQGVTVRSITTGGANYSYGGGSYENDFGDRKYRIWKYVNGTATSLAVHATETVTSGDVLRLEVSGTTLTLFVNGVQKVQVTDSSLATGQPGLFLKSASSVTGYFDDWSGGDLAAAADPFIPSTRARLWAPLLAQ